MLGTEYSVPGPEPPWNDTLEELVKQDPEIGKNGIRKIC